MKINTFSIVIGNKACNARCPFCVSRMTGFTEVSGQAGRKLPMQDSSGNLDREIAEGKFLWNFTSAKSLAKTAGTTTVLLTGKGEPTLFPDEITAILRHLRNKQTGEPEFPIIELQTNALKIGQAIRSDLNAKILNDLALWRELGLSTIAISVVSTEDEENAQVYTKDYPSLIKTVEMLHWYGFTVRIGLMLLKPFVSTPERLKSVIDWCKTQGVAQLTVRPIRKPEESQDESVSQYVRDCGVDSQQEKDIVGYIRENGKLLLELSHGATIYDVHGQNVCLTDCLTQPNRTDQIRTLIYYPKSGRLAYDWQYQGAVIFSGRTTEE